MLRPATVRPVVEADAVRVAEAVVRLPVVAAVRLATAVRPPVVVAVRLAVVRPPEVTAVREAVVRPAVPAAVRLAVPLDVRRLPL